MKSRFGVDAIYLSHFAISDIEGKKYYHFSNADSRAYGFGGADSSRLRVRGDRDELEGNPGKMHITADARWRILTSSSCRESPLSSTATGVFTKIRDRRSSRRSDFSSTDLETTGTVKNGDCSFPVTGKSWFDGRSRRKAW